MMKLTMCSPMLMMGALLLIIPNMMRRQMLFAVPVAPDFRESREGRHAVRLFRTVVALALAFGLLAMLALPLGTYTAFAPLALAAVSSLAYYKAKQMVAPFRVQLQPTRSIALTDAPDKLPRFVWLSIAPFVLLAAAAIILHQHWNSIPQKFPVHIGLDGIPNRWAERSITAVYGPLFAAAEICAWLVTAGLASWFGARRSQLRLTILTIMIATEFSLALLFTVIALQTVLGIPVWIATTIALLSPVPVVILAIRKFNEPSEPAEKTPHECWKAGFLYYNPNDAAVVVEKRSGLGYTFNFANPWSWALLGGLIVVMLTLPLVIG
jgi:uncharacterized membrane protein